MDLDRKRWFILAACVLTNVVSGAAYASSVFAKPMMEHLKCTKEQWALAFSLSLLFLPIGMLMSGRIADRGRPRVAVAMGAVLFGLGVFLAGFSNSLTWLYLTFGAMLSLGSGSAYGAAIAVSVRWFPERRGMASGVTVGALGFGTAIIAPLAQWLILNPSLGVLGMLKVLGAACFVILVLASLVLANPPAGYAPAGFRPQTGSPAGAGDGLNWTQMLAKPRFWLLYALYAFGAFSGLMIISQASPIAQEMAGLNAKAAAGVVSVLGLANATGRVFWGSVSDKIGRLSSLALMFFVTLIVMFLLPGLATHKATLIPAVILIGTCFGGYLGTFPSLCADSFGTRNAAVNYALLFSAFGLAGVVGPKIGARFAGSPGGYAQAFVVAGVISVVGLLLALGMRIADAKGPKTTDA